MPAAVQVRVRLDKKALDKELKGRGGSVSRTMSAFGGIATREIKNAFFSRAGGAWWPVSSSITDAGSRGVSLRVNVKASRPHKIKAVNAPALIFNLSDGTVFWGSEVNHPGSSPPEKLVLLGIERAGRRLTFTRAAPSVTRS
jgi:hypothetical protein